MRRTYSFSLSHEHTTHTLSLSLFHRERMVVRIQQPVKRFTSIHWKLIEVDSRVLAGARTSRDATLATKARKRGDGRKEGRGCGRGPSDSDSPAYIHVRIVKGVSHLRYDSSPVKFRGACLRLPRKHASTAVCRAEDSSYGVSRPATIISPSCSSSSSSRRRVIRYDRRRAERTRP